MKTYRVFLTDTANGDLRDITFHILDQSKERDVALKFISVLRERCAALSSFPDRGAYPKDSVLKSAGYRYLVHKDYLVFYRIQGENGYVEGIFNAKKDYMRVLKRII